MEQQKLQIESSLKCEACGEVKTDAREYDTDECCKITLCDDCYTDMADSCAEYEFEEDSEEKSLSESECEEFVLEQAREKHYEEIESDN